MVRVGSGAAYRMIFSKRYTFDALTVVLERAANDAVWESSNIGIYNQKPKKRATTATGNCFKVDHVCTVVVVVFRTAICNCWLNITYIAMWYSVDILYC